ncbi:MAG: serine hydrolase domain-containing protein [Alphaproteobacteria bacterium]
MSHASGLASGFLEPESLITQHYTARKVLNYETTLAEMMDILSALPLDFHPGTSWGYSCATNVLGRMVEIISGQSFDEFLRLRIFEPFGIRDTGFFVPPESHDRLAVLYSGADLLDPMKGG